MESKRQRLEAAGSWLRETRVGRGYATAGEFARALGIDASMVSRYERGVSEVDDERAKQISAALNMSLLDVRRGLGLWVPDDEAEPEPVEESPDDRASRLERMLADALAEVRHLRRDQETDDQRRGQ